MAFDNHIKDNERFYIHFFDRVLGEKMVVMLLKPVKKFIGHMSSFIKPSFLQETGLEGIF